MKSIPNSIVVFTGDETTSVSCKQMGENIVPVGCFYDEGERYKALTELLILSVFPLFYKINEKILALFQCKQKDITYSFALYRQQPQTLTMADGMHYIINMLRFNATDDFYLYVNINCTREVDGIRQEWGKQITVEYGNVSWTVEVEDGEYPVWFLYIEHEKTVLETPFSKKQVDSIITSTTTSMLSYFIDTYGPYDMEHNNGSNIIPAKQSVELNQLLDRLLLFLKNNRYYNILFQISEFKKILLPYTNPHEKLISLLYHVYNTQSQPGLDNIASFMGRLHQYPQVKSFQEFIELLNKLNASSNPYTYDGMFSCLKKQAGWGEKTAALFTKAIYKIHTTELIIDLRFWNDLPILEKTDKLYLPVDAVIQKIFDKITDRKLKGFAGINQLLQTRYSKEDIEIWDDLWFWGFITQRSNSKGEREDGFAFNKSKYWSLMAVPKDEDTINKIRILSNEFIAIITSCYE